MAKNWIPYSVSDTPSFITSDDLQTVPDSKILEYFSSVKLIFSVRTPGMPGELQGRLKACPASELCALLKSCIISGLMDTGWIDDYEHATEEISARMGGYPRVCLPQWRKLRLARSGGIDMDSGPSTVHQASSLSISASAPIPAGASLSRFRFLDLPAKVRQRIFALLFFRGDIHIGDWSCDVTPPGFSKRTEYDVYDSYEGRLRRTSYTVRDLSSTEPFDFSIMLGNKQLSSEASEVFYGKNTFKFLGTAESALAFFHDRPSKLNFLCKVSMRFSTSPTTRFRGCYNATCPIPRARLTYIGTWRRIHNLFVHSSIGLEDYELILDDAFWLNVDWEQGAEEVFDTRGLCERLDTTTTGEERNFLQHVARLSGVNIRVTTEGPKGDTKKEAFRRTLEWLIQQKAFARPHLTDDEVPKCTCNRRYLKECCMWDKWARWRRR